MQFSYVNMKSVYVHTHTYDVLRIDIILNMSLNPYSQDQIVKQSTENYFVSHFFQEMHFPRKRNITMLLQFTFRVRLFWEVVMDRIMFSSGPNSSTYLVSKKVITSR